MPQMSPMWWTLLFLLFVFSYIYMNMLIYFLFINKKLMIKNYFIVNEMSWSW